MTLRPFLKQILIYKYEKLRINLCEALCCDLGEAAGPLQFSPEYLLILTLLIDPSHSPAITIGQSEGDPPSAPPAYE